MKEKFTVNSCVKWTRDCCMGYYRADHFSRISYLIYYRRGVEAVSFEVCGTTVDWAYKKKFCTKHLFKVKISDVSWGRMRQAKQYKDHFQCICFYFALFKKIYIYIFYYPVGCGKFCVWQSSTPATLEQIKYAVTDILILKQVEIGIWALK